MDLNQAPPLAAYVDLPRLAELAQEQVKKALDSFVRADADEAQEVLAGDDHLDDLFVKIFNELLAFMMEDSRNIRRATSLVSICQAPGADRRPRGERGGDGHLHGARHGRAPPAQPGRRELRPANRLPTGLARPVRDRRPSSLTTLRVAWAWPGLPRRKVLVVDDDPSWRSMIVLELEELGYEALRPRTEPRRSACSRRKTAR